MARLIVSGDADGVAADGAEHLTTLVEQSMAARGNATVCLTGGTTPRRMYELLGDATHRWRGRIAWDHVHLFWGDERHVPPDHPDSNYGMADAALVRHVPVPAAQVHRMRGELADARAAAADYDRELRDAFAAAGRTDLTFDVMLLGLGEDAHIASIFPGSELLDQPPDRRVAGVWAAHLGAWRITLTPPAILDARAIVMVVAGAAKAHAVHAALESPEDVSRYPAQLLRPAASRSTWIIDTPAASALNDRPQT